MKISTKKEAVRRIAEVLAANNVFGKGHPYYERIQKGLIKLTHSELEALYMVVMYNTTIEVDIPWQPYQLL